MNIHKKLRFLFSLIGVVGIASFASAQPMRFGREDAFRQSLLGNVSEWFFSSFGRSPSYTPVRGGAAPIMRPGISGPVMNGATPSRGPVSSGGSGGGSCYSCGAGTVVNGSQCVAANNGGDDDPDLECCPPIWYSGQERTECRECFLRCLASSSRIATPTGNALVTELKVGDIVWTADIAGNRVVRSLTKVSRVSAPNHQVVHLVLKDGRTLDVSAPHPTADGRTVGDLKAGDAYDGGTVESAVRKPYEGSATYDILPAGDTGYYWANGVLIGSTLK